MPDKSAPISLTGEVTDLFGHRFVVQTKDGKRLADLGPRGAERVRLAVGDRVTLTGEPKPTEVKVHALSVGGREFTLESQGKAHSKDAEEKALAAVRAVGFAPLEPPRRKHKHFEIRGERGGERLEFHVEFDGAIRKTKPAKP